MQIFAPYLTYVSAMPSPSPAAAPVIDGDLAFELALNHGDNSFVC